MIGKRNCFVKLYVKLLTVTGSKPFLFIILIPLRFRWLILSIYFPRLQTFDSYNSPISFLEWSEISQKDKCTDDLKSFLRGEKVSSCSLYTVSNLADFHHRDQIFSLRLWDRKYLYFITAVHTKTSLLNI